MSFELIKQLDYEAGEVGRVSIRVTGAGERAIKQGHPWLFEQAISEQNKAGHVGDLAVIYDKKRKFLAVGLYDPNSPIRVRVLASGQPVTIDEGWFKGKLEQAAGLREGIDKRKTNGYRVVHGENDELPGLIVDRYDRTAVVKIYTAGWVAHLPGVLRGLGEVLDVEQVVLRLGRAVAEQGESLRGLYDGMTVGGDAEDGLITFLENGLTFEVDPVSGQKTGFFLDQRENRLRVGKLAKGKSVLNVFSYTGGFSLYAARGGAKRVTSLDISGQAIAGAVRNFELNKGIKNVSKAKHDAVVGDAFEVMQQMADEGKRFDVVVVDPPAFASSAGQVDRALGAYRQLAKLAARVTRNGGMLVSASCSSRVGEDAFFEAVNKGVGEAGKRFEEVERTGHGVDHPIGFKEGAYLKCLYGVVR